MRYLAAIAALALGLMLIACSGTAPHLVDGKSVSTTYSISGTVHDDEGGVVVGQMGCWDITDSMSNIPDYVVQISNAGTFSFDNLPAGRDYYVWVWVTPQLYTGWITNRQPLFMDLDDDESIRFVGILPD